MSVDLRELVPAFVISRASGAEWRSGRAGMLYRDLIPGRQGGRFIASQIRIPDGGDVGDWVHFHRVRFQIIFCHRGWVRVAYEDQGPPVVLRAGDCVVQPPTIRHRVLECSDELSVVEVASPAAHETCADDQLTLEADAYRPQRTFEGQRFVFHQAEGAAWRAHRLAGFEARDTSIGEATGGVGAVVVVRPSEAIRPTVFSHDAELLFWFVLEGRTTLHARGQGAQALGPGDAVCVPAGLQHALSECSEVLRLLEVSVPAAFTTCTHPEAEVPA